MQSMLQVLWWRPRRGLCPAWAVRGLLWAAGVMACPAQDAAVVGAALQRWVAADAAWVKVAEVAGATEGPQWVSSPEGGFLVFSEMAGRASGPGRVWKWVPGGEPTPLREGGDPNGNLLMPPGRLWTCLRDPAGLRRTGVPGGADAFFPPRPHDLIAPNDLAAAPDGSVWFTDPDFKDRRTGRRVLRMDVETGAVAVMRDDFSLPNGLAFIRRAEPEGWLLLVGNSDPAGGWIRRFAWNDGRIQGDLGVFAEGFPKWGPDGIKPGPEGTVWVAAGAEQDGRGGIEVYEAGGQRLGRLKVPGFVTNLCFGGPAGRTVFATAGNAVFQMDLK